MATIVEALRYALTKLQAGELAEAERIARDVLGHEPGNVDALHMLGLACRRTDRNAEAIEAFRKAIAIRPDRSIYYFELGIALKHDGDPEGSLAIYRQAVEIDPNLQEAYVNGGAALDDLGRHEEAIQWYLKSRALKPNCASTLLNMGNAYQALGQVDEAIRSYDCALGADPQNANAHWNRGMALLRCGRFRDGWEEYEWRTAAGETKLDDYPQPRWDGSSLAGKTLLVHAEQGVGDEILFASCYPELIERAAHCIFVCEMRLVGMYSRSFPQATVRGYRRRHERTPCDVGRPVDFQIPAGSVPRLLRPDAASFPDRSHYLLCDPQRLRMWRERLDALGPGLKVGISWRAGGKPSEQVRRTTGLSQWRGILSLPGVQFVNLQYGDATEDIAEAESRFGIRIHDWPDADALTDLEGLAAQICALDLVVAVGNTTVHLAGSLGVEAWSLLPATPSWRWMSEVDRVPWYTTVRLIRQRRGESWKPVFDTVRRQLCERLGVADEAANGRIEDHSYGPFADAPGDEPPTARIPAQVTGMNFVAKLNERMQDGVKVHQAGDLPAAERIYREVLRNTPQHIDALHLLGVVCQQTGRGEQAIKLLRQAITLCDTEHNFHFHLGLALRDAGRTEESLTCYRRAVELKPDFAEALLNLGGMLQERGCFDEAIDCYQKALEGRPEAAGIHLNLGSSLRSRGRRAEAERHLRTAVRLQPVFPEAHVQLGQVLHEVKQLDEAIACYQRAVDARPEYAAGYRCLGKAYQDQQRLDEAIACYQRALELKPNSFDALANMGLAFQQQEQFTLAVDAYRRAYQLDPKHRFTSVNMVLAMRHLGQFEEALTCCDRALALDPHDADMHLHRAAILLQRGDFAIGWDEYVWRSKAADASRQRTASLRHWDGAPLDGRTVFVQPEASLDDEVLFASCVPNLIGRTERVVLACDSRLVSLWSRSFPTAIVQAHSRADGAAPAILPSDCDVQISAGDLPRIFRRSTAEFPQRAGYLVAERASTERWQDQFAALGNGLKIGLLWKAEKLPAATSRAPAWQQWRGVLSVPGVQFVSLQATEQSTAIASTQTQWGTTIHTCEPIEGLDDLAARMAALDLVIAVDDPIAHLSGALGTRTWTLLSHAWGWRWMLPRDSAPSYASIWYPSMQLFRPRRPSAWPEMMNRVQQALTTLAADRASAAENMRHDLPHPAMARRHAPSASQRRSLLWP